MESSPQDERPDLGLPDASDNTLEKIACIEELLNRMQQVPHASDVFLKEMLGLVNKEDVSKIVELQNHMLSRFEKTNEMLLNFNSLSMARYETTCQEFTQHTELLMQMKKDLDNVFRRIRNVKSKLRGQYPEAFGAAKLPHQLTEEEEEIGQRNAIQDQENNVLSPSQSIESQNNLSEESSSQLHKKVDNERTERSSGKSVDRPKSENSIESYMDNIAEVIEGED